MSLNLDKSAWRRVKLGEVVRNVNNTTKDPESLGIDRVIAMEHMDPGELAIERWGDVADGTTFTRVVTPGQTLFGKRRAYQRKVAYAEFDAICSSDIYTFEAIDGEVAPELLPFLVQSERFFDHALGTSAGSLSPRTNWRDLADFEFDLPPVPEQERLAALLWAVEYHHMALRTALMSLSEAVERLLATQLVVGTKTLRDWVVQVDAGRSPRGSAEPASADECGVLKVSAVGSHGFVAGENKRLLDSADFRPGDAVRAGDVLVTRANASVERVAYPCLVDADHPNLMLSDKTLRLVHRREVSARVLVAVLKSEGYRSHVSSEASGTEAKNISQAKILAGPVPDLAPAQLTQLDASLQIAEASQWAIRSESTRLTALRFALLNEIFGGN